MKKNSKLYKAYIQILKEELVPAMGCTEPISITYGAARARDIYEGIPEKVLIEASGNIIKNVKSVVVPNTNGLKGIEASAAAGIIGGKAEMVLEVISNVNEEDKIRIKEFLDKDIIKVKHLISDYPLDFFITVSGKNGYVKLRILEYHTNIVYVEKNGEVLFDIGVVKSKEESLADKSLLNVESIIEFADTVKIEDVYEIIKRQIDYNSKISEEGFKNNYGANIGRVLFNGNDNDIKNRAKAAAAAGSDARMGGCELPVIIISGSGNQGITASLPVIEYSKYLDSNEEELIRALIVADLCTIHQKTSIGRLSAFCGAVSAGAGSGAGIAYLHGGNFEDIAHTIVNSLAIVSGIICDGAKPSCAAKIASSVDAGILGYEMYKNGKEFYSGDGIVTKGVENTIKNVGRLGKEGMKETDLEIIKMMVGE